ncbi:hypothetical protein IMAU80053_02296 [Lactiplantibacillus plantarum]|nr:hypothetical protein S102022_01043 [Lactiplantibacillus plantarum]MCG0668443.1 hypothetical protein [Lactiplantibacillus plantarum]
MKYLNLILGGIGRILRLVWKNAYHWVYNYQRHALISKQIKKHIAKLVIESNFVMQHFLNPFQFSVQSICRMHPSMVFPLDNHDK